MATQIVELTGDEQKLIASLRKAQKAEQEHIETLKKMGAAGQDAGQAIDTGLTKAAKNPNREFDKLLREMRKFGPEGRKQAHAIEVHLQESGKAGRRSMEQVVDAIGLLDDESAKVARQAQEDFQKTGKAGKKAFGEDAVKGLAQYAAGWVSVSAAVGLVSSTLEKIRDTQKEAFESLASTVDADRRLLQISNSTDDYQALTKQADDLAVKYGLDRNQSRQLLFSARSEGFENSVESIAANEQILSLDAQATVAGQIPGLFKKEGLTPEQAINMGLVAAAESRLNFEEIARSLPGAAEGGSIAGASSEETFGALSVLAGRFKSGDTAADRLKAFTTAVGLDKEEQGLAGTGIVKATEKLLSMSEEERGKFLGGSQELNAAFIILKEELPEIKRRIGSISEARETAGTPQSAIAERREAAAEDPKLAALLEERSAANFREIENERRRGIAEARGRAGVDRALGKADEERQSEAQIALTQDATEKARTYLLYNPGETTALATGVSGENLGRLQRTALRRADSFFTSDEDEQRLVGLNFLAGQLRVRENEGKEGLTPQDIATFRSSIGDTDVTFNDVTQDQARAVTEQIRALAKEQSNDLLFSGPSFGVGNLRGALDELENLTLPRPGGGNSQDSSRRDAELIESQNRTRDSIDRLNSTMEKVANGQQPTPTRGPQQQPATGAALAGARAQLNN